jgi:cell division protein FtsZ
LGILTVAVVTKPFIFEGRKRMEIAEDGINKLASIVDSLITIPNNKLLPVLGKNISLLQAFKAGNDVLLGAVQGIAELITKSGLINVDFADVRTVMAEMGMAMMGTANARGEERARVAAEAAISSPLLEDVDLNGAGGVLVNITAGPDMSIGEFEEVGHVIKSFTSEDATVVVGTVIDQDMIDELRVTVVVTGFGDKDSGSRKMVNEMDVDIGIPRSREVETIKLDRVDGSLDYRKFDKPAVLRSSVNISLDEEISQVVLEDSMEYLEIPTFLRKEDKVKK